MANTHYYSKDVNGVKSEPKTFECYFKNKKFIFDTDNGVFIKQSISDLEDLLAAYRTGKLVENE